MSLWLEKRYANLVAPKLNLFKWKKPTLANFRCPYCNDSQKNKRKARGYLYAKGNAYFYKCHNCPTSTNFSNFLKHVDPALHLDFLRESFVNRQLTEPLLETTEVVTENNEVVIAVNDFRRIDSLPESHFARQYIESREIPKIAQREYLFYTDNTKEWIINHIDPNHECTSTAPCVGIFIKDKDGNVVGVNCRSLKPENQFSKYIKAKVNPDVKLIFGIDRIDRTQKVYVFEGEFDSMFIPNSVAVGGVGMMSGIENLLSVNKEHIVQVVDNDPRNKQVVKAIENLVEEGYAVTILPGNIEGKDVNQLVIDHKYSPAQIKQLIDENTFCGLSARLKISEWKRC